MLQEWEGRGGEGGLAGKGGGGHNKPQSYRNSERDG